MNDFEKKLSERLDNPTVDQGIILEAEEIVGSYEEAEKKHQIPEKLYLAYVKYHGKDNALPHKELNTKELIHPTSGKLMPLASWPTKKTREASAAHWTDYNVKLRQPKPEIEVSPCANPEDFVNQIIHNCVATGQRVARWTPQQAMHKCGKQIDRLRKAVYDYCNGDGNEESLRGLIQQMSVENPNLGEQPK
jgi:hypothetical protein